MKIIPYGRQEITDEDIQCVVETLRSDFLTQGPKVAEFEKRFCEFVKAPYGSAVINGTAALHMAVMALGIKPGQKVLVPALTFAASGNCVLYCGGEVDLVDIDPETLCLNLKQVEDKLKNASAGEYAGVVAVDFAGYPIQMDVLKKIADQYNVWVLEDACHAFGAQFKSQDGSLQFSGNGKFSSATAFSFHPVKHIATGEGGLVTTADKKIFDRLNLFRTHGITKEKAKCEKWDGDWYYEMQELGYNYRIPDILCALGVSQLSRADENLRRRNEIANIYRSELKELPIKLPPSPLLGRHAYHLFVIQTQKRNQLFDYLRKNGVYAQVHYIPMNQLPYYKRRYGHNALENVDHYYTETISLPMYHALTDSDQSKVIDLIKKFYA